MTHVRTIFNLPTACAACLFLILSLEAQAMQGDSAAIRPIVLDHFHRYPKMEIQDLYKFVFHAAMGNEHLMNDSAGLRAYLDRELREISADSTEPTFDLLTPDSALVRLHLRPFKARNGDPALLIEAMITTASIFQKSTNRFRTYWSAVMALAEEKIIPFSTDSLSRYFKQKEAQGFPAVHHSNAFESEYKPAYRLILRSAFHF
jgi:hypothetical protein